MQIEKLDVDLHKQNSRLLSSGEKSNISKIDSNPCFEVMLFNQKFHLDYPSWKCFKSFNFCLYI